MFVLGLFRAGASIVWNATDGPWAENESGVESELADAGPVDKPPLVARPASASRRTWCRARQARAPLALLVYRPLRGAGQD